MIFMRKLAVFIRLKCVNGFVRMYTAQIVLGFCTIKLLWIVNFLTVLKNFYADCKEVGFAEPGTSFSECLSPFGSANDDICYHFREDYCRFDWDLLDNLEYV